MSRTRCSPYVPCLDGPSVLNVSVSPGAAFIACRLRSTALCALRRGFAVRRGFVCYRASQGSFRSDTAPRDAASLHLYRLTPKSLISVAPYPHPQPQCMIETAPCVGCDANPARLLLPVLLSSQTGGGAASQGRQSFVFVTLRPVGGAAAMLRPADCVVALPRHLAPKPRRSGHGVANVQREGSLPRPRGLLAIR